MADTGLPCPTCAGPVPDDTIWVRATKFYCSEKCAKPKPYLSVPTASICYPRGVR